MLSFSDCLVCACFFIHAVSVIVSQEEPSPTVCNQQIYEFYKLVIFEKKRSDMCRSILSLNKIAHQMWLITHCAKEIGQQKKQ